MIKKHILILEVNAQNFDVLKKLFVKHDIDTTAVISQQEYKTISKKMEKFDAVLVNSHIDYADVDSIMEMATLSASLRVPVVFLDNSKQHNKEMLQECYEKGVADYIKKPFDSKEIVARMKYHTNQFFKLREFKTRVDKLANLATVDQLSKSTSKMHMQAILKHELSCFERYSTATAVIYLSLLNVNRIVGTFGLEKGEKLISAFAKELRKSIRSSDVLSRWSGSDFIILLAKTDVKAAELAAKKINNKLSATELLPDIKPSLAFGITGFCCGDSMEEVIQRSKYALKEAKKQIYGKIYIADAV